MLTGTLPEMSFGRDGRPGHDRAVRLADLPALPQLPHQDLSRSSSSAYIDTGKVRYILREFPIGKTSGNATRCPALRASPTNT